MKKILAISLVFIIMLCATACSSGNNNSSEPADNTVSAENKPETALSLFNSVWDLYGEDEKFPVAGGDFSEENASMTGPGKYSLEDAAAVDAALGFPANSIDDIDDAASLTHMMNANNFTGSVYHVKDGADVKNVANAIKENIATRQWMCGFPEKLYIATYDSYVIVAFGSEDLINTFKEKLEQTYTVDVVCYEAIE